MNIVNLLENVLDVFNELDAVTWEDDSSFQGSNYEGVKEEVEVTLKKLKDEI